MKRLSLSVWLVLVVLFSFAALAGSNPLQLAHGSAGHGSPLAPAHAPDVQTPDVQPSQAQGSDAPLSDTSLPDTHTDAAWDFSDVTPEDMAALTQAPLAWSEIDWRAQLFSHWHNKLVHFPLVLGLVAALLRWRHGWQTSQASIAQTGAALSKTQPSPPLYSAFLTATTALALLAAFTGQQQAHPFMAGPLRQVLSLHQALGILSVLGFAALLWLDQRFPKQYLLLQTLALSLLVALLWGTGLLGGLLAQSH